MRGAEGTAGSGFRLVEDAVSDDYNDYGDYECLAVSASLLPTDRINLTFWRRHFVVTFTVHRLFFTTLNAIFKQQVMRDGLGALECTELQNHSSLVTGYKMTKNRVKTQLYLLAMGGWIT